MHTPVLLNEVLEILDPKSGKFIIDGTADGGGHLEAIIRRMKEGKILAVEWDADILAKTKARLNLKFKIPNLKLDIHWANDNYANIPEILEREKLGRADGILLDLGFSSEQLESFKGFSFKEGNQPLDMRYNQTEGVPTAAEAVNSLRESELAEIIFRYGEERFSRKIARGICMARKEKRIITVGDLVEVTKNAVPKFFKKGEMDVVARTFQALRIYVNGELENLEKALENLPKVLNVGGVGTIISFHSLEDRMIKNYFRKMEQEGIGQILTRKAIEAGEEEVRVNPRSRSAKLRAIIIN